MCGQLAQAMTVCFVLSQVLSIEPAAAFLAFHFLCLLSTGCQNVHSFALHPALSTHHLSLRLCRQPREGQLLQAVEMQIIHAGYRGIGHGPWRCCQLPRPLRKTGSDVNWFSNCRDVLHRMETCPLLHKAAKKHRFHFFCLISRHSSRGNQHSHGLLTLQATKGSTPGCDVCTSKVLGPEN